LPDINFDTGAQIHPAVYELADETYAELLERLAKKNFAGVDQELKGRLLGYYANLDLPFATKKDKEKWQHVELDLKKLRDGAVAARTADAF
jgi:predicted transcriptional regulator